MGLANQENWKLWKSQMDMDPSNDRELAMFLHCALKQVPVAPQDHALNLQSLSSSNTDGKPGQLQMSSSAHELHPQNSHRSIVIGSVVLVGMLSMVGITIRKSSTGSV